MLYIIYYNVILGKEVILIYFIEIKKLIYYSQIEKKKNAHSYDANALKRWNDKSFVVRIDTDNFSSYMNSTDLEDLLNIELC